MSLIQRTARETLTPIELDQGDILEFKLKNGACRKIELKSCHAEITETTVDEILREKKGAVTNYRFYCTLEIDGKEQQLTREVASQKSFYEPLEVAGLRIWFDAVAGIFEFLTETHGECRPKKQARFAIQDADLRICPEKLHLWCPLPKGNLRIEDCYNGEDCWMGAYFGASAHGGLDINHAAGTPLWAPFDIDDQYYFNSVEMGDNNNRWRGLRTWEDGSLWIIQAHHMRALTVEERTPLKKGQQFAEGAGVWSGSHEHSHFVFRVRQENITYHLDPWILFWQMLRDLDES